MEHQVCKETVKTKKVPIRKKNIKKLGTVKIGVVESTPIVFDGKLLRFEWIRNKNWGAGTGTSKDNGYYHIVNMETEEEVSSHFAVDHSFGCAYTENGVVYAHGVRGNGGGTTIDVFWSSDLQNWESQTAITLSEDFQIYNTSVCKSHDGYIMAIEVHGSNPAVGDGFTNIFAKSADLKNWELLDVMKYVYSPKRYTACPSIRYYDGYYYIVYLEALPLYHFAPYIVRTKDLANYEMGLYNPILMYSDEDKKLMHPERFTEEQKDLIANAYNSNDSDVDFCTYEGKTIITYSWGNQAGTEFLALAEYDGTEEEFLKSYF